MPVRPTEVKAESRTLVGPLGVLVRTHTDIDLFLYKPTQLSTAKFMCIKKAAFPVDALVEVGEQLVVEGLHPVSITALECKKTTTVNDVYY